MPVRRSISNFVLRCHLASSRRLGTHQLGWLDGVIKCTHPQAQLFTRVLRIELGSFLMMVQHTLLDWVTSPSDREGLAHSCPQHIDVGIKA